MATPAAERYPRLRDNVDIPLARAPGPRMERPRRHPVWIAAVAVIAAILLGLFRISRRTVLP